MTANRFARTRDDHSRERAEDYCEMIAALIRETGDARAGDLAVSVEREAIPVLGGVDRQRRSLAAESVDRSEVVRFRSADFSFSAVVRQDGGSTQVRLLADDPNTRAFLGDRLPEVRQALERVGFASTSLSVATDADRQQRQRDDQQAADGGRDERPEPLVAPLAPLPSQRGVSDLNGDGHRGLHLIL